MARSPSNTGKTVGGARVGRPPKELAGDVEQRILDAAQQVFLQRGFEGASIDEIAERAPVSKPTIYARYAGKDALFAAVLARVAGNLATFDNFRASGRTVEDRLIALAQAIIERALRDSVGLMRVAIADAYRFPDVSCQVHDASRGRILSAVAQLLTEVTGAVAGGATSSFVATRPMDAASVFLDMIILPILMRRLMGAEEAVLRNELPAFLRERVGFFMVACASDALPRK